MPVATKTAHITNTLITYLEGDASLVCKRVWDEKRFTPTVATKANLYVWPSIDNYGGDLLERGDTGDMQIMQMGIYCEFIKAAMDVQGAGTLMNAYAEYSERVEKRIDALKSYLRNTGSVTDTTTVGGYTISIIGVVITNRTGFTDSADKTKSAFIATVNVKYIQS